MPSRKKSRVKRNTITYTDKKKLWRKMQKKKKGKLSSGLVKQYWNHGKTVGVNLRDMGLSLNPNASMKVKPKQPFEPEIKKKIFRNIRKPEVIQNMESVIEAKNQWKGSFQLPIYDQQFCQYMLEHYGDSYKEMSKDRKNVFQLTPAQLRKKMAEYKRTKANSRIDSVGRRALRPRRVPAKKMDSVESSLNETGAKDLSDEEALSDQIMEDS